jgi:hypothetical protein
MDVSTSTNSASNPTQTDPMKKAMGVQDRQILKVLESAQEQTSAVSAQKTGMGNNINITA